MTVMDTDQIADAREVRYRRLIDLGIALSAERNHNRLMEMILLGAKDLTHADGGTLYLTAEAAGSCVSRSSATTAWALRWAAHRSPGPVPHRQIVR